MFKDINLYLFISKFFQKFKKYNVLLINFLLTITGIN